MHLLWLFHCDFFTYWNSHSSEAKYDFFFGLLFFFLTEMISPCIYFRPLPESLKKLDWFCHNNHYENPFNKYSTSSWHEQAVRSSEGSNDSVVLIYCGIDTQSIKYWLFSQSTK